MVRSLQEHGQLSAVMAFEERGKLQLLDGFKRLRAAKQLGWPSLLVHVLSVDVSTATAIIAVAHEQTGLSELEQAWIIRSLCREHGLSQGAVARLLRRHKSWVSRRLLLAEGLEPSVQVDVRLGLLSPRSALAVAALPRGNQQEAAALIARRGMTTRQAETLVRRLQQLDSDEQRESFIHQWPKHSGPAAEPGRVRSEGEQLLTDVATIMRVGVRLEVRLREQPTAIDGAKSLHEALRQLASQLHSLDATIARALAIEEKRNATMAKS